MAKKGRHRQPSTPPGPPRPRADHLRLVGGRGAPTGRPTDDRAEASRGDPPPGTWTPERVKVELELFYDAPQGRPLTYEERYGLGALLEGDRPALSHDGTCGVRFVHRAMDPATLDTVDGLVPLFMQEFPRGLRAWVRFCRSRTPDSNAELTVFLLDEIDRLEPAWRAGLHLLEERRRANRPGVLRALDEIAADLGGHEALARLTDDPLPDEPLDTAGLDDPTAAFVTEVAALCDAFFSLEIHRELRTVARRLVALFAHRGGPAFRRPKPGSVAAAVCHLAIHGNRLRVRRFGYFEIASIAYVCGVSPSGVSKRATALLALAHIEQPAPDPEEAELPRRMRRRRPIRLGDAQLLVSGTRRWYLSRAAQLEDRLAETAHLA
ncbi:hypothetical protein [Rhabdothermincola salaria]|uniref:hypothetical protein n=1 Tax=Rhabdothermincola salaria TaxID=2903142 RepID=UPI001E3EE0EC|nr:hypothetical protein [Rhabdothermincola salaria]MCD9623914.1 hypothetical protein [Rhabdothermincola salaria]